MGFVVVVMWFALWFCATLDFWLVVGGFGLPCICRFIVAVVVLILLVALCELL